MKDAVFVFVSVVSELCLAESRKSRGHTMFGCWRVLSLFQGVDFGRSGALELGWFYLHSMTPNPKPSTPCNVPEVRSGRSCLAIGWVEVELPFAFGHGFSGF